MFLKTKEFSIFTQETLYKQKFKNNVIILGFYVLYELKKSEEYDNEDKIEIILDYLKKSLKNKKEFDFLNQLKEEIIKYFICSEDEELENIDFKNILENQMKSFVSNFLNYKYYLFQYLEKNKLLQEYFIDQVTNKKNNTILTIIFDIYKNLKYHDEKKRFVFNFYSIKKALIIFIFQRIHEGYLLKNNYLIELMIEVILQYIEKKQTNSLNMSCDDIGYLKYFVSIGFQKNDSEFFISLCEKVCRILEKSKIAKKYSHQIQKDLDHFLLKCPKTKIKIDAKFWEQKLIKSSYNYTERKILNNSFDQFVLQCLQDFNSTKIKFDSLSDLVGIDMSYIQIEFTDFLKNRPNNKEEILFNENSIKNNLIIIALIYLSNTYKELVEKIFVSSITQNKIQIYLKDNILYKILNNIYSVIYKKNEFLFEEMYLIKLFGLKDFLIKLLEVFFFEKIETREYIYNNYYGRNTSKTIYKDSYKTIQFKENFEKLEKSFDMFSEKFKRKKKLLGIDFLEKFLDDISLKSIEQYNQSISVKSNLFEIKTNYRYDKIIKLMDRIIIFDVHIFKKIFNLIFIESQTLQNFRIYLGDDQELNFLSDYLALHFKEKFGDKDSNKKKKMNESIFDKMNIKKILEIIQKSIDYCKMIIQKYFLNNLNQFRKQKNLLKGK